MIIQDVIQILDELAPLKYAEDFDNVGLLVGNKNTSVTGILVTLDTLEPVIEEAINNNCNLIISFHPIIFKGLKSITGNTYVERTVLKAIQNNIAIFAIHTALDNAYNGVNDIIANKLGLQNKRILIPQKGSIKKLLTYIPSGHAEKLRQALFEAGAGAIGNYDHCSFNYEGMGTYLGNSDSNPVIGQKGKLEISKETAVSVTYSKHLEPTILRTLFYNHPYEEVAYEVSTLENTNQKLGMGMIGELKEETDALSFLRFIKSTMKVSCIKFSQLNNKPIKSVAVLGGSGSFAIEAAKAGGADIFISSDLKYHDFFRAENKIILADIGHYESEQFTKSFLVDYLSKKISNFAIILSKTNTNPVNYL